MTATPSRPKPRPMNKESAAVDNFPQFLASALRQQQRKTISGTACCLGNNKSSSEFADGSRSDCFASQFCNFEFSESRRRALVRSSALCARASGSSGRPWDLFLLNLHREHRLRSTTFKVVNFLSPSLVNATTCCMNSSSISCIVYGDNGFQICMLNFIQIETLCKWNLSDFISVARGAPFYYVFQNNAIYYCIKI